MRKFTCLVGSVMVGALVAASSAQAATCEGVSARKYEKPMLVFKGKDKSKVYRIQSTGVTLRKGALGDGSWQHCGGLWTVNADKSGSGSGHCYTIDPDGDQRTLTWTGDKKGGTWKRVSGTGKYAAGGPVKGTWGPGSKFPDGMRIGHWAGECND